MRAGPFLQRGKTMLLRVIARLNSAGGGDFFGGRQINEIDPSKRSMMKDAENQAV